MKRLWSLFSSIWLTVVLALLICVSAAWGSISTLKHPELYSSLDRVVLLPGLFNLPGELAKEAYWIFALIILVALFSVNTMVCTTDRVYRAIKTGASIRTLFPHVVHIGFLIAVTGHLAGSVWGFKSQGNILYKGRPVDVPHTRGLSVRLDEYDIREDRSGRIDFLKTTLTLFEDKKQVLTEHISINSPLIYRGIAFYHADQGSAPDGIVIKVNGRILPVRFSEAAKLPDGHTLTLGDVYPDFALDRSGSPYSRSGQYNNPFIEVRSDEGDVGYLDLSGPGTRARLGRMEIELTDLLLTPYVVLTINRDPGIGFIIVGSIVLVAGMVLLLFFRGERSELVREGRKGS